MPEILLVEDDPASEALIRSYTRALPGDCHLTCIPGAGPALARAREHPVDLFLLDIQLPDYRGTRLAGQIRDLPDYRFTPILFTTEVAGAELDAYRTYKCYDFLVKPFSEETFCRSVTAALEMGRQLNRRPAVLRLEQRQFRLEIELDRLLYAESFGKNVVLHSLAEGTELTDRISGYSLARILEMAGPDHLVQCHKSFLINPAFLRKIDRTTHTLQLRDCAAEIPIGAKYQANLEALSP